MKLFLTFIFFGLAVGIVLEDYCKKTRENTPCLYRCKLGSRCNLSKGNFKLLSNEQRQCILDEHNDYRNRMAGGEYMSNFLPKISNMNVLSYDKECEFVTGCYIKQCIWAHDKVRRSVDGSKMGQNLYTLTYGKKMDMDCTFLKRALNGWVNSELKFMNQSTSANWGSSFIGYKPVGHLSQVFWARTKYVGCAIFYSFKNGRDKYSHDIFCNYLPSGNVQNIPMYKEGAPTTLCDAGLTANDQYTNLCGTIRQMSMDKYLPPTDVDLESKSISQKPSVILPILICTYLIWQN